MPPEAEPVNVVEVPVGIVWSVPALATGNGNKETINGEEVAEQQLLPTETV